MLDLSVTSIDFDKIRITDANGETKTYSIQDELKVNKFNVREEFLFQSSKYAYWCSVLEQLKLYEETYELQTDRKKAEIYEPSRKALIAEGIPKPTKDQIEAKVILDDEYYQLCNNVVAIHHQVDQLKSVVKAFEQRKDMLVQYGADQRKEMEYSKKISMPNQTPENY